MTKHPTDKMIDRIVSMTIRLVRGERVYKSVEAKRWGVSAKSIYRDIRKIGKHLDVYLHRAKKGEGWYSCSPSGRRVR